MSEALVAFSPMELQGAQTELTEWLGRKVKEVRDNLSEVKANLEHAREAKWRVKPWENQVAKAKHQLIFYSKIKKAVELGYLIIPNFPIDAFAVRVKRDSPRGDASQNYYNAFLQSCQVLEEGKGRYVSDRPEIHQLEAQGAKEGEKVTIYNPEYFKDVEFPVVVVKPSILEKTTKALRHLLFDEVGLVGVSRKSDPIVCARIYSPKVGYSQKFVTFFIAWWLDFESL